MHSANWTIERGVAVFERTLRVAPEILWGHIAGVSSARRWWYPAVRYRNRRGSRFSWTFLPALGTRYTGHIDGVVISAEGRHIELAILLAVTNGRSTQWDISINVPARGRDSLLTVKVAGLDLAQRDQRILFHMVRGLVDVFASDLGKACASSRQPAHPFSDNRLVRCNDFGCGSGGRH